MPANAWIDSSRSEYPETSRARIQQWIRAGRVTIDRAPGQASSRLRGTELIAVDPGPAKPLKAFAEDIPLDILYEDEDLAAINKPAGMTVHAGGGSHVGNARKRLASSLWETLRHRRRTASRNRTPAGPTYQWCFADCKERPRTPPLGPATSVPASQENLLVPGPRRCQAPSPKGRKVEADGQWWTRLEMPVHRDRRQRAKMAAGRSGRSAQTDFRPLQRWPSFTLLEVRIATGRTHQIRVHLSSIGHPVVGDRLYGAPASVPELPKLERFFLHARAIGCRHPTTDVPLEIEAPLPEELQSVLEALEV